MRSLLDVDHDQLLTVLTDEDAITPEELGGRLGKKLDEDDGVTEARDDEPEVKLK